MNIKLFLLGVFLTVVPLVELRGGLPMVIFSLGSFDFFELGLAFLLIVFLNIGLIFFLFFFLENVHCRLIGWKFYYRTFDVFLKRARKKADKISRGGDRAVFVSLFLLVAVPLPLTGAYTGTLIAWLLGLDKFRSVAAISLGVLVAGVLVMLASVGVFGFLV